MPQRWLILDYQVFRGWVKHKMGMDHGFKKPRSNVHVGWTISIFHSVIRRGQLKSLILIVYLLVLVSFNECCRRIFLWWRVKSSWTIIPFNFESSKSIIYAYCKMEIFCFSSTSLERFCKRREILRERYSTRNNLWC